MAKKALYVLFLALVLSACAGEAAEPVTEATGPTSDPESTPAGLASEPTQMATTESAAEESAELEHVRVPMGFVADPQFAPFYVASDKGYYVEEGLEIEFDYSFETDGIALVGANELQFAIVSGEQVILARAQDLPIVYVFEWYQRYPIAVVSEAEAGIESPEDLAGRDVGLPGFWGASYVGYVGLLSVSGLTQEDVNASEIGFNQIESLLSDQSEAVVTYANNEPVQLEARGEDVNVIYVADYIDLVANGIVTNEETIANRPELVEGFIRATWRGLTDTLQNPAEAYEISKRFVEGLDDSRIGVLEASLDLWQSDELGLTEPASWEQTEAILLETGFLDAPLDDLEAAYSNEFVLRTE
jgi:NitT/TauT family transport system substrate-binding protein